MRNDHPVRDDAVQDDEAHSHVGQDHAEPLAGGSLRVGELLDLFLAEVLLAYFGESW